MKVVFLLASVSRNAGGLFHSVRRLTQEVRLALEVESDSRRVCVLSLQDEFTKSDVGTWAPIDVQTFAPRGPRSFGFAPGLAEALEAFNPDVVSTHGLWMYTSVACSRWARAKHRPYVIHPHGMVDPWSLKNSAWKKRLALWAYEGRNLRHAACIRALCDSEYQSIRKFGLRNPVCVIPNGIDLPELQRHSLPAVAAVREGGSGRATEGQSPNVAHASRLRTEEPRAEGRGAEPQNGRTSEPQSHSLPAVAAVREGGSDRTIERESASAAEPQNGREERAERKRLLFLGRLHPKKGLPNLIRAWAALRRDCPAAKDWILQIAGWDQGGHEAELKRMAKDLGLESWMVSGCPPPDVGENRREQLRTRGEGAEDLVEGKQRPNEPLSLCDSVPLGLRRSAALMFLGPRFGAEKDALLRGASAFILPSYSEGLPMAILEAWAYALPVLMTPECNLPEGYAAGAAVRISTEQDSIGQGLRALVEMTDAQRWGMGACGRNLVAERFAWSKIAAEMKSVYEWVLGGGARPGCVVTE